MFIGRKLASTMVRRTTSLSSSTAYDIVPAMRPRGTPLLRLESAERILPNDGLVSVRTGGNDGDRHFDQGLQPFEVAPRVGGQRLVAAHSHRALLPSRKVLVHRLGIAE